MKIPELALPIVEILRRDVPPPEYMPDNWDPAGTNCRWGSRCPMGLHKLARYELPVDRIDFPLAENIAIMAFYMWWDSLNTQQIDAAMALIWPTEVKHADT